LSFFVPFIAMRLYMTGKQWIWTSLVLLLLIAVVVGVIFTRFRYIAASPVEITITRIETTGNTIYIDGGVVSPGYYPFSPADTISSLLQTAGGTTGQANLSGITLYVATKQESQSQKIDINRADAWLLQALPGIGQVLSQRIIDYRMQNGLFPDISSIMKVSGIGEDEFDSIREFITVSDD
jgi:competence protein ComEA